MKSKENRFRRKKVKKRVYSITIQKSKVFGIFDDKKVKNIDVEYRLQSIFPNPAYTITKIFIKPTEWVVEIAKITSTI